MTANAPASAALTTDQERILRVNARRLRQELKELPDSVHGLLKTLESGCTWNEVLAQNADGEEVEKELEMLVEQGVVVFDPPESVSSAVSDEETSRGGLRRALHREGVETGPPASATHDRAEKATSVAVNSADEAVEGKEAAATENSGADLATSDSARLNALTQHFFSDSQRPGELVMPPDDEELAAQRHRRALVRRRRQLALRIGLPLGVLFVSYLAYQRLWLPQPEPIGAAPPPSFQGSPSTALAGDAYGRAIARATPQAADTKAETAATKAGDAEAGGTDEAAAKTAAAAANSSASADSPLASDEPPPLTEAAIAAEDAASAEATSSPGEAQAAAQQPQPSTTEESGPQTNPAPKATGSKPGALRAAQRAERQGKLEDAESLYRAYLQEHPGSGPALTGLAFVLLNRGKNGEALETATQATKTQPSNAKAWITLGAARQALGNAAGAADAYRSCARLAGRFARECKLMIK